MGSVYEEITRLETAKTDIETAIEGCGVSVPDTKLISDYALYIRQIPSAVFSELNVDLVGGEDLYIKSIKLKDGLINATTGGLVSSTSSGLVPKITDTEEFITNSNSNLILTYENGETPQWKKFPILFSGKYEDLNNTPVIGNGIVTITLAGKEAGSFSLNSETNVTIDLTDTNTWRNITDSVSTISSDISASATAVKAAYDKAVSAYIIASENTSNEGTVTKISTGVGLLGGDITTTGTIKCNLNSETSLGTLGTTTELYAVGIDSQGKLCVKVPLSTYTFTNKAATLNWDTTTTIATVGGVDITVTLPANPNTNDVTQTLTSSNATYPLLLAPSGQTATTTTTAYFDSGVTLNPNTNTINANISGSAGSVAWDNVTEKPTIPNVTDYYWANVKIGSSSNEATTPIFSTIKTTNLSYVATLRPNTTTTYFLGSAAYRWKNIFSDLGNFSGQIISSVATGTSPFNITSTTVNTNLNADLLDGIHATDLFSQISNSGNTISITIGGTNKTLTVGYATKAGSATDQTARNTAQNALTIANSKWTYNENTIKEVKVNNSVTADKIGNYLIWVGSQTDYKNITHDANTIYFITE